MGTSRPAPRRRSATQPVSTTFPAMSEQTTPASTALQGMTGFGRSSHEGETLRIGVEIRTVNHRFCEVMIRLPRHLAHLETRLRRRIGDRLMRGRADVSIQIERLDGKTHRLALNNEVVGGLLEIQETLQTRFGLGGELSIDAVVRIPDVVTVASVDDELSATEMAELEATVGRAVDAAVSMRADEGRMIAADLAARLATVASLRDQVEAEAGRGPELLSRRLRERLAEALPDETAVDESRLAHEVALLAEKCDVSEELVRLLGYLDQAREALSTGGAGTGKRLEFMLQEMNRETNTVASKAAGTAIGPRVVEIKTELERMREQVLNLA
ncbi:MAG: YicC/YloC family endoribonuclease [Acidobacteriota bacterium]